MAKELDFLNSFILEFKEESIVNDIDVYEKSVNSVKAGKLINVLNLNPSLYTKYIDNSIDNLKSVTVTSSQFDNFFSNIYNSAYIDDKKIAIPLQDSDEIEKFRPDYITSISSEYDDAVKKILNKQMTYDDVVKKYVYGSFFSNIKKSIVKSKLNIDDPKDLMRLNNPSLVKIDKIFLQSSAIPFFRSFDQNVNDVIVLATNTKGCINNAYRSLNNSITSLRTLDVSDPDVIRTLNFITITFMKEFMNICAYVTAMLIRKMSFLTFNNASYTNLYNTIYNYFPEGELVLHESVIDGNIADIDDATLLDSILSNDLNIVVPHIQKTINLKKIELANIISKKYNFKINFDQDVDSTKYQYNVAPYTTVVNVLIDIAKAVIKFHERYNDESITVDELIAESNLDEPFEHKYQNMLTNLLDISFYENEIKSLEQLTKTDDRLKYLSIYNDLNHFLKNATIIARNVKKIYAYLEEFQNEMDVNNYKLDVNRYNEIKSFVETLMTRYKDFALQLTKKLLARLDNLTDMIEDSNIIDDWSIPESYVPWDYTIDAFKEAYEDLEIFEKEVFEELARDYITQSEYEKTGMTVVFEAEKVDGASANPTVQTNASEQNVGNQQQTTPQNNQNNTTGNTNTTNNNQNNNSSESLIKKFVNFIKTILDKFMDKVNQLCGKNNKWLASVKSGILNLNYDNTKISVAKYEALTGERLPQDIQGAVNKINAININNLPSELVGRNAKAEFYLFPSIPQNIKGTSSFSERIKHYFTFGSDDKNTLITYSGDEAKSKVQNMIAYCEGYDNMTAKLKSDIDKLTNAALNKQRDIALNKSASATTESVIMEARRGNRGNNNNTQNQNPQNPNDVKRPDNSNVITGICRDFTAAILTICEKKYLDYIKVLSQLVPNNANPQNEAIKSGAEAENQQQEQQK